jgi:hypothetical protein
MINYTYATGNNRYDGNQLELGLRKALLEK